MSTTCVLLAVHETVGHDQVAHKIMYFIINLSGSQQFSGSAIQNQVELSEWATGCFMHCISVEEWQKM